MGEGILSSSGFVVLATIVAFNTLIYVGLTIAKLIPWPRQLRPAQVRALMDRLGLQPDEEAAQKRIPSTLPPEGKTPSDRLRYGYARGSVPQAFSLAGGLVMMLAVLGAAVDNVVPFAVSVLDFLCGLALLIIGVSLWYGAYTGRSMIWTYALASSVLVTLFLAEAALLDAPAPLIYALLLMAASLPILIDRTAALAASAAMLFGVLVCAVIGGDTSGVSLFVLSASALMIGALLLEVRLRAIRAVGAEIARSEATATTDLDTDLLTQRGLVKLVPSLTANASRCGQPVFVVRVNVHDLDIAAQRYGQAYADTVMRTVAGAARTNTRRGDLISRWAPDAIVILGQGGAPDPQRMRVRLERSIQATDVSLGRTPIEISVASAAGDPDSDTSEGLFQLLRRDTAQPSIGSLAPGEHESDESEADAAVRPTEGEDAVQGLGEGRNPVDRLRYRTARESIPRAFVLAGGLVVMLAFLGATQENVPFAVNLLGLLGGLALMAVGVALRIGAYTGRSMIWAYAVASTVLVVLLLAEAAILDTPAPLIYALLLMVVSLPILIDRKAALVVGTAMLFGVLVFAVIGGESSGVSLFGFSTSALMIGALLLEVRLRAIDDVGAEIAHAEATATTDVITGLLTRRGLLTLVPSLAANASRAGQLVCMVRVHVPDLAPGNRRQGRILADGVMRTVAQATVANTRAGDLISRWGRGELIILGRGAAPDPEQMRSRLERSIHESEISHGSAPIAITVASVVGDPDSDTFEGLLLELRRDDASVRATHTGMPGASDGTV